MGTVLGVAESDMTERLTLTYALYSLSNHLKAIEKIYEIKLS